MRKTGNGRPPSWPFGRELRPGRAAGAMDIMRERLALAGFGKHYMRIAYRLPAVAFALVLFAFAAHAQPELSPPPADLEPAVNFWTRVYTEVDTGEGFIHDDLRLVIVYQTVHTGDLSSRERRRRV